MEAQQPAAKPSKTWVVIVIVVVLLLAACASVPLCAGLLLALMGPAVGNVFSNIITSLPPTP